MSTVPPSMTGPQSTNSGCGDRGEWLAARMTPAGTGAIAVIRFRGPCDVLSHPVSPLFVAASGQPWVDVASERVIYGKWGRAFPEDVVLLRPAEGIVEIHCHGGEAAVRRILDDLEQAGARIVSWQEMLSADGSLLKGELWDAVSRAITLRTAALLLTEAEEQRLERWARNWLTRLRPPSLSESETEAVLWAALAGEVEELLTWSEVGRHLVEPWTVVLTGRPNAGKSSLLNRLLGYQRAIVHEQPGTTRDLVTGVTAFAGWPVRLIDTAGLRETHNALEAEGIARAREAAATADLELRVIDVSQQDAEDAAAGAISAGARRTIVVAHKVDLPRVRWEPEWTAAVAVSSHTGAGVDLLIEQIIGQLLPRPAEAAPVPLLVTERQVACVMLLQSAARATDREAAVRGVCHLLE